MAVALTDFQAMCGFRDIKEIIENLKKTPELRNIIGEDICNEFIEKVNIENEKEMIKKIFSSYLTQDSNIVEKELDKIIERLNKSSLLDYVDQIVLNISKEYPNDRGFVAPYFLNVSDIKPGEGLFLNANTPHAYIKGDIVEIMSNSNNVVRVGLTEKFIDIPTLISILTYESGPINILKGKVIDENLSLYIPPQKDFMLEKISVLYKNIIRLKIMANIL